MPLPTFALTPPPAQTPVSAPLSVVSPSYSSSSSPMPTGQVSSGVAPLSPDVMRLEEENNKLSQRTPDTVGPLAEQVGKGIESYNKEKKAQIFNAMLDAGWDGARAFFKNNLGDSPDLNPDMLNPHSDDPAENQKMLILAWQRMTGAKGLQDAAGQAAGGASQEQILPALAKGGALGTPGGNAALLATRSQAQIENKEADAKARIASNEQKTTATLTSLERRSTARDTTMIEVAKLRAAAMRFGFSISGNSKQNLDAWTAQYGTLMADAMDDKNTAEAAIVEASKTYADRIAAEKDSDNKYYIGQERDKKIAQLQASSAKADGDYKAALAAQKELLKVSRSPKAPSAGGPKDRGPIDKVTAKSYYDKAQGATPQEKAKNAQAAAIADGYKVE